MARNKWGFKSVAALENHFLWHGDELGIATIDEYGQEATTTCLVCGYDKMEPLELGIICPSCGTQYGISDEEATYSELRQRWIHLKHAKWGSQYNEAPAGWSPIRQLLNINYKCSPNELRLLNYEEMTPAAV